MTKDIYIIKNDLNNKVYIGQSTNSKRRFQGHCKPSAAAKENEYLGKAIQYYGKEHFWYEILESQVENYNEREKYWISFYNSIVPNGYNILNGGEEPPHYKGSKHPESALTEQQVQDLTFDLINTSFTFSQLAQKYGLKSKTSIYEFNKGLTYVRPIPYPVRKEIRKGKLSSQDIEKIIDILKHTYRSFENIGKQYGVEARTISRINRGIFHRQENEKYPIRNKK